MGLKIDSNRNDMNISHLITQFLSKAGKRNSRILYMTLLGKKRLV